MRKLSIWMKLLMFPMWVLIGVADLKEHNKWWWLAILAGLVWGYSGYLEYKAYKARDNYEIKD